MAIKSLKFGHKISKVLIRTTFPFRCWFNSSIVAVVCVMRANLVDPPGIDGSDTFLECFNKWYNSSVIENPEDGIRHFFRELRPLDDAKDRMNKMW